MFSRVNVQIKSSWQKCLEWIARFGHKYTIYRLKFGWFKFDESRTICKILTTKINTPGLLYIAIKC